MPPATHLITISLKDLAGGGKEIEVDKADLTAHEGDTVEWTADWTKIEQFAVDFCASNKGSRKPKGPFNQNAFSASNGKAGGKVNSNAGGVPPWRYQYAVAVLDKDGNLYALDPEIRIRPN